MHQKLYFANSKGDKLCGLLSNPELERKRPLVIFVHGFASNKDSRTHTRLMEVLNQKGFPIFRFDLYGHGESDGKFENITITEAVDDVLSAMTFLKRRGYKKIGLFGSSFGGMASLLAAPKLPDLVVLALKSPVSDYTVQMPAFFKRKNQNEQTWKRQGYIDYVTGKGEQKRLNYSYFEASRGLSVYKFVERLNIPTIIVHGDQDEIVPLKESQKLNQTIPNSRLEIIQGADHPYSNPEHFEKMLKLISDFIMEHATVN